MFLTWYQSSRPIVFIMGVSLPLLIWFLNKFTFFNYFPYLSQSFSHSKHVKFLSIFFSLFYLNFSYIFSSKRSFDWFWLLYIFLSTSIADHFLDKCSYFLFTIIFLSNFSMLSIIFYFCLSSLQSNQFIRLSFNWSSLKFS